MTQEKKLVRKLSEVMNEVKYIQKKGFNKFHKYSYATESDVAEKVREELAKRNVMMIPSVKEHILREHTNRSGNVEYIVTIDMEFTFFDGDTGEEITFNMSGEGQDAGDKAIYKAITGAQKYALMKVFMIPTGDDPERDESVDERNHGQQPASGKPPISQKQVGLIKVLSGKFAKMCDKSDQDVLEALKITDITQLNVEQASAAIDQLNKWISAKEQQMA
jgi:hypothetical protein